jgi:hypothetical protein
MARRSRTDGADYRLVFTPTKNPQSQTPSMRVSLETAQAFAAFRYGLSVLEHREGTHIHYTVRGLEAPDLSLPGSGHAGFIREYDDLWGTCTFQVKGLDGTLSSCSVRLIPGRAELITKPDSAHLVVETLDTGELPPEHP